MSIHKSYAYAVELYPPLEDKILKSTETDAWALNIWRIVISAMLWSNPASISTKDQGI